MQAAAAAVAETYRAAGWVVRAYLPQQDIQDGIVTLQIVEAVFGSVKLEGRAARVASEQLLRNVSANKPGVPRSTPTPSTAPSCLPTTCPASPWPAASPPAPPRVKPT